MRQLQPLPRPGKCHRVIADDITAANGMNADLVSGPFAHQTFTAVPDVLRVIKPASFTQDLRQLFRRPARSVFLQAMMHLANLEIEVFAERLGSLARQPKERIYAHAEIR